VKLSADFARLDEYKTDLAAIAVQLPPQANLADLTHTVAQLAADNSVTVVGVLPGVSGVLTLPTPVVVQPPATGTPETAGSAVEEAEETADEAEASAEERDDAEPVAPAAPQGPAQIEGFVAYPVVINVLGSYPNVLAFLEQIQTISARLFLVTDLDATRQRTAPASQGRPATVDGDLELMIAGYAYVLTDQTGITTASEDGAETEEPAEAVMPGSDRNPFIPLAPTGSGG